jgi:hypothetical protein
MEVSGAVRHIYIYMTFGGKGLMVIVKTIPKQSIYNVLHLTEWAG